MDVQGDFLGRHTAQPQELRYKKVSNDKELVQSEPKYRRITVMDFFDVFSFSGTAL